MTEEPASTDEKLLPLQPLISSPFEFDLDVAARLGAEAKGVEIGTFAKPEGMVGVPDRIPVVLIRGDEPKVEGLAGILEQYRTAPSRKRGTATVLTFESFCDLVNRHKTADSAIFANTDWQKPSLTAVIDYHILDGDPEQAANGKHRIHYAYPLSEEWKKWVEKNGKSMTQEDFAWFLEDRIPELSAPTEAEVIRFERDFAVTVATPAQVVQLSRGLQVNVGAKIKAVKNLQSGEGQISFEEEHSGADGKPLKIPGVFVLSIAPFFMGDRIRVPVRLRYRPTAGSIVWFYEIYRPDLAITEHVRDTLAEARTKTELPTFEGSPEMAA